MSKNIRFITISFFIAAFALSCDPEQSLEQPGCVEGVLEQHSMIRYNGEELGCKFFITLFDFRGKQYFQLGNHCADIVTYPFDCHGVQLCIGAENELCAEFARDARYIGIVGMNPD